MSFLWCDGEAEGNQGKNLSKILSFVRLLIRKGRTCPLLIFFIAGVYRWLNYHISVYERVLKVWALKRSCGGMGSEGQRVRGGTGRRIGLCVKNVRKPLLYLYLIVQKAGLNV